MEGNHQSNGNSRGKIVLSYLIPIIGIIFVFTEKNATREEKEHYAQAATSFLFYVVISIVSNGIRMVHIPLIGFGISILSTLVYILGIVVIIQMGSNVFYKIPGIYELSKTIFKK